MITMYQKNRDELNSPEFARELHSILRNYTHNSDPYKAEKKIYNDLALEPYP